MVTDEYFWLKYRNVPEPARDWRHFLRWLQQRRRYQKFGLRRGLAFVQDVGDSFIPIYSEIVRRNEAQPWSDADREEQLVRRGRYAEFNLLCDRGAIFGLKTGGNIASILSSMPPLARWP